MNLEPYARPLQPAFKTPTFRRAAARWRPIVKRLVAHGAGFYTSHESPWVGHWPADRRSGGLPKTWCPKLYVCVCASAYWDVVARLVRTLSGSNISWKFYMGRGGYDRPDKIVFYARSRDDLASIVARVRPLLSGCSRIRLRHAASTVDVGLERRGRVGLHVGCDPVLLGAASWRIYRALTVSWAKLNRSYLERLPGGLARWFARMNLHPLNEGPASFAPDPNDRRYVRRYWRLIVPG